MLHQLLHRGSAGNQLRSSLGLEEHLAGEPVGEQGKEKNCTGESWLYAGALQSFLEGCNLIHSQARLCTAKHGIFMGQPTINAKQRQDSAYMLLPMPSWRAVSLPISSWSPVIIFTWMPMARQRSMVSLVSWRGGSNRGTTPASQHERAHNHTKCKSEVGLRLV